MRYRFPDLTGLSSEAFIQAIRGIPKDTTFLDLEKNNIVVYASALIKAFKDFTSGLTGINLGQNNLGLMDVNGLKELLQSLPESISEIDLGSNKLGSLSESDWLTLFEGLGERVNTLRLAGNGIKNNSICAGLKRLSPNMTTIDLSGNFFTDQSLLNLKEILKSLPNTVISIDLSQTGFHYMSAVKLKDIWSALHKDLKEINFQFNQLGLMTNTDLKIFFHGLPPGLKKINLMRNHLDILIRTADKDFFSTLPQGLISIDLSCNGLGWISIDQLEAFRGIGANVSELHLCFNDLDRKTNEALVRLLQSIPPTVKWIVLDNNDLFKGLSTEEANLRLTQLNGAVHPDTRLSLRNNGYSERSRSMVPILNMQSAGLRNNERVVQLPYNVVELTSQYLHGPQYDFYKDHAYAHEHKNQQRESHAFNMSVLGLFITSIGIVAVAAAFVVLSQALAIGLLVGGGAFVLIGLGIFCNRRSHIPVDSNMNQQLVP